MMVNFVVPRDCRWLWFLAKAKSPRPRPACARPKHKIWPWDQGQC